ncbi:MAG TPA: tetratricopeptide repeat protein [Terriglobales bacterium]|nr:tetratricopeptide repeat protein [Terriglobales bacterium]
MELRPSALFLILALALPAWAQSTPWSRPSHDRFEAPISGVVRDYRGNAVNGARVEIQELMTGRTVITTYTYSNGSFQTDELPAGRYEIVAIYGLTEARMRFDPEHDRDVTLSMPAPPTTESSSNPTVSLSQMKVPGKARKFFQKALDAFRKSRIDDAFGFVQQALGMYPDYAQALALRGVLNLQKGDTQSAQPDLEKAVALDYGDGTSFVALASLYNVEGKFQQAQQVLERGLRMHPDSWQALTELARAQIGRKEFNEALGTLARSEKLLPPSIHYPLIFRAQAYAGLKNYPAAVADLQTFLQKEPDGPNSEAARKTLGKLQEVVLAEKK